MLRTNTDLNPLDAMLCDKQLWTVEQTFRTAKRHAELTEWIGYDFDPDADHAEVSEGALT